MNDNILITILAQDRKRIVLLKSGKAEVTRNLGGGKEGKYAIVAGNEIILETLGTYAEEKEAIDALEKLFAAIAAGEKTYIMN